MGVKRLERGGKMAQVICPGEVLIDFISLENGKKLVNVERFQKKAGGAPANVATALVKLGASAEFVGAIGKDSFGKFLTETLERYHVGTKHIVEDSTLGPMEIYHLIKLILMHLKTVKLFILEVLLLYLGINCMRFISHLLRLL